MGNEAFLAALPENLRADPALKDFGDVGTLAKSYLDTKALVGGSIRPPGPDATPEARKEFIEKLTKAAPELVLLPSDEKARAEVEESIWRKLGKPADPNEYKIDGVDIDPAVKFTDEEITQLREGAKRRGYTVAQFKKVVAEEGASRAAMMKASRDADQALRTEWGLAYEEKVLSAKATAMKLGVPEADLARIPTALLKVFANAAKALGGETRQVAGQGAGANGAMTPAEAKARMTEMEQSPTLFQDRAMYARYLELGKSAFPE